MKKMQQVNPITARLRDILRNYSSAQLLNELLQECAIKSPTHEGIYPCAPHL